MSTQFDMNSILKAFLNNLDVPMITQNDIIQMLVASVMAAIGMGTNSTATVIGSMLISLVGAPIFESAFFSAYKDVSSFPSGVTKSRVLLEQKESFVKLIIFTLIPVIVGLVAGGVFNNLRKRGVFQNDQCATSDEENKGDVYPAKEMTSRGLVSNLLPGLIVALICGIMMVLGIAMILVE